MASINRFDGDAIGVGGAADLLTSSRTRGAVCACSTPVAAAACHSSRRLDATLTGIDISEESARRNKRITQIIIGDLRYHPLPAKSFDVVICCAVPLT
ncbi:MAG: class I SAM-dependent methyltransferase [Dongiaceae bacterium]